jgi:hypothetical protein
VTSVTRLGGKLAEEKPLLTTSGAERRAAEEDDKLDA